MSDQRYRSEDIELTGHEPKYPRQSCEGGPEVNTGDQISQGLSVKKSLRGVESTCEKVCECRSIEDSVLGDRFFFQIISTHVVLAVGVHLYYGLVEKVNQVLGHRTGIICVSDVDVK